MENPGSYNQMEEAHPELESAEILELYTNALKAWRAYCEENNEN